MQQEFTEQWGKLCQSITKPMTELTQLNINTLSNLAKNTCSLEELTQAKKPEDLATAHMKFANAACVEATKYTQKALEIGLGAMSEAGKIWADTLSKTTTKASEFAKTASILKSKE